MRSSCAARGERTRPSFFATRAVKRSSSATPGTGRVKSPAFVSCQTYSLDEPFWRDGGHAEASVFEAEVPVHSPGLGPALLLPFAT